MRFRPISEAFRKAAETAWQLALQHTPSQKRALDVNRVDLRWWLEEDSQVTALDGGSAGTALALLLTYVLRGETMDADWAATAALNPHGQLQGVHCVRQKSQAAFSEQDDQQRPQISRILVHPEDAEQARAGIRAAGRSPVDAVWTARNLAEALALLEEYGHQKWPRIDCRAPAAQPDEIRRERLLSTVRTFVREEPSGYVALVGGAGLGKSTAMGQLIREAQARGEDPVFHVIENNPYSPSAQPEHIAACLYERLLRKHRFQAPAEWESWSVSLRLQRLLERLSQATLGLQSRREVIYIDAADQARIDAAEGGALLPGVLPHPLPPGVYCVISSRPHTQEWLRTPRGVQVLRLSDCTDDRTDIREWLRRRGPRLTPPLEDSFIQQVVSQEHPPVFFTVASLLRTLEDQNAPAERQQALRSDPAPWTVAPEELIAEEALRVVERARGAGIQEVAVWRTLGLLAVARVPLSEEDLRDLGLWDEGVTGVVLRAAANFFQPRPLLPTPALAHRFDHPGYVREILPRLAGSVLRDCHARWRPAAPRRRADRPPGRTRCGIAGRIVSRRGAGDDLAAAYADVPFVVATIKQGAMAELHDAARRAGELAEAPWREAWEEWERFLRWRVGRLPTFPAAYVSEVVNEFLPSGALTVAGRSADCGARIVGRHSAEAFGSPASLGMHGHSGRVTT